MLLFAIKNGRLPAKYGEDIGAISLYICKILKKCWNQEPQGRPSVSSIVDGVDLMLSSTEITSGGVGSTATARLHSILPNRETTG
jgi:hypothetical protein